MIPYNCNTLVAVSILCSRLQIEDVLVALNRNVPAIGGDGAEFKSHHVDQIWDHMRHHQIEWHTFALTLKHNDDPRIDRGVENLRNGCLHEDLFQWYGGVTFHILMMSYDAIIDPEKWRALNARDDTDYDEYSLF
jgi:hypothetical protein